MIQHRYEMFGITHLISYVMIPSVLLVARKLAGVVICVAAQNTKKSPTVSTNGTL